MSEYTKEDICRMIEEEDVEFIRLQFTDMFGTLKNVAVTTSQLDRVLNNEIMFDGASIAGFAKVEQSDLFLHPDIDTFTIFPWRPQQGKVARFLCDIYYSDGTPFKGDPRYMLKRVLADAKEMGYRFDVGPECEFFLFHTDDEGNPTTITHEKAGYFDVGPLDLGENARRDMILTLEEMGFIVEASHHEDAPAQHEIDFHYDEALNMADAIMTFKMAVKTIAKRHGLYASFMPKPKTGVNGNGMHVNMSLSKDGVNAFYDADDAAHISQEGFWFIGVYCMVAEKPQPADPDSGAGKYRAGQSDPARGASQPGFCGKSVSGACGMPCGRSGWHPKSYRASGKCGRKYL